MSAGEGYMPQLDGLRAVAAIAVVFSHTVLIGEQLDSGGFGVNVFFVLSGFLITGILLDSRAAAESRGRGRLDVWKAFYARRFLRIFPLYYAVLALGALLGIAVVWQTLPWTLTYLTNFLVAKQNSWPEVPVAPLWSLAVEEQFYLIVPVLFLLLPRKHLLGFTMGMVALGPLSRMAMGFSWGDGIAAIVLLPSRLDTLGLGALLAVIRRMESRDRWKVPGAVAIGAIVLLVSAQMLDSRIGIWPVQLALHIACQGIIGVWLVSGASLGFSGVAGWVLGSKPLVYVGRISYGVYVYHGFVLAAEGKWFSRIRPRAGLHEFVAVLAVTIVVAAISWHLFESPINGLKKYFPYLGGKKTTSVAEELTKRTGLLQESAT